MPQRIEDVEALAELVEGRLRDRASDLPLLVALSGIDASGKGTIAARLTALLEADARSVALIPLDPWHSPAAERFGAGRPVAHFFERAFRFDELFSSVIEPLRRRGSIDLEANLLRPFENTWYTHRFVHDRVEVILVEGIFLLRRELRSRYDLTVWIACSFETALARALARNQEGLDRNTLERDYRTVYFPAQQYHLERDQPEYSADLVLPNDRRSAPMPPRSSDPAHPAAPENPPQD